MANDSDREQTGEAASPGRRGWSVPERVTLALSLIVVVAVAGGALLAEFRRSGPAGPVLEVEVTGEPAPRGSQFQIPITVTNAGNGGAEQVTINVALTLPNASPEPVSLVIALLPAGGSEEAVVVFASDPAAGTIDAWVESYLLP